MPQTPDDLLSPDKSEAVDRLTQFYANGTALIKATYADIDPQNVDREKVTAQIATITNDLENGTRRWIEEEYPAMYVAGALVARKLLNKELKKINKKVLPLVFTPTVLEKETITTLGTSTFSLYSEALSGVRRKTASLLDSITQEKIKYELSQRTQAPLTLKELKGSVVDIIKESGAQSLTDRAGKTWQLDTYAEMVARTQHATIVNTATRNQALLSGFDLVRVSIHGASDSCAPFEGRVYSLTGATPGYQELFNASSGTHLFGPNCKHTYTPISEERAKIIA